VNLTSQPGDGALPVDGRRPGQSQLGVESVEPRPGAVLTEVEDLTKLFPHRRTFFETLRRAPRRYLRAVDGVSITIRKGESVGLAGESGSGKSVTADLVARLQSPSSGTIRFGGHDVTRSFPPGIEEQFRRSIGMVFQDPYDSLNPRMRVEAILAEPLEIHDVGTRDERRHRVHAMLERVHLSPASEYADKYPHELSGGERQRVAIGRALILDPLLLIADEPTTMLDVSVRSGLLNLIREMRSSGDLALLFISHDFSTLRYVCDRIVIMYLGRVVETGPIAEVLARRLHPYTRALCAAIPIPDPEVRRARVTTSLETAGAPEQGCPFEPRCPLRIDRCRTEMPPLVEVDAGHAIACHVVTQELRSSATAPLLVGPKGREPPAGDGSGM
jgi:peptide/nickel transport system ATP-binding protein